ncbi:metal-dependent hydrolase [candidate division WOR_3 bacterium SM23_42]|uniref:Metal-dependent hydrolase n=1 Tax=candidate division WOR_3 bacterium SM23_42 TaxID=1703779 RepID=A0A0S8FUW5_UNCW3|nr:MAG: metal-dependent hydrolase [candidate division WOR_3 bacterium SM23_42]
MINITTLILLVVCLAIPVVAQESFEKDVIETSEGDLEITFIGHGTLIFVFGDKVVHVDPWSRLADYSKLPKADLILLTHHHGDHLDPVALQQVRADSTIVVLTEICAEKVDGGVVMENGDQRTYMGIDIIAVPAYNVVHKRDNGELFHPKGEGNGYVLTFGDTRIYIAGDTENTPEMKALEDIDYAFLPMNLPYTMTPGMVVDAVCAFKPKVLYPYHYGDTNISELIELLKDNTHTEVRIRKMQ